MSSSASSASPSSAAAKHEASLRRLFDALGRPSVEKLQELLLQSQQSDSLEVPDLDLFEQSTLASLISPPPPPSPLTTDEIDLLKKLYSEEKARKKTDSELAQMARDLKADTEKYSLIRRGVRWASRQTDDKLPPELLAMRTQWNARHVALSKLERAPMSSLPPELQAYKRMRAGRRDIDVMDEAVGRTDIERRIQKLLRDHNEPAYPFNDLGAATGDYVAIGPVLLKLRAQMASLQRRKPEVYEEVEDLLEELAMA